MIDAATLTASLAPAFAVGLGVQHLNEVLDPVISKIAKDENMKKSLMGMSSLIFSLFAAWQLSIHVVQTLTGSTASSGGFWWMDLLVTALIMSTGTEGINSLVKFLSYSKDQKKAAAAQGESVVGKTSLQLVNREP